MKTSNDWHSLLRCLWKQDQMLEMSLSYTYKRQCSKGRSIWSITIMLKSLVMNFDVWGCKNHLSAVRWLHPLKISLGQRLAPESESSLAKITLHKQRLQQIKGVSTLVWITLHAMTVMHFWDFGLAVSLCAFKRRSPSDLHRRGCCDSQIQMDTELRQ